MKPAVLLAVFFGSIAPVFGGELAITSPDHPRTFAYGEMIGHQLYVDPASGVLTARITFSNLSTHPIMTRAQTNHLISVFRASVPIESIISSWPALAMAKK